MRLTEEQIIQAFNDAVQSGHPDPLGFMARADILTGLNDSKSRNGFKGPFGVSMKKARQQGFTRQELNSIEGNLQAAVLVDQISSDLANGDLEEMYRISFSKGNSAFQSFFKRLNSRKEKLDSQFQFNSEGLLTALKPEPKEKVRNRRTVTRRAVRKDKLPDDFVRPTSRSISLSELDGRLESLITTIVEEQPI